MANRTVKEAKNLHGTNPQYLVEKIIRSRIYDCQYWKEQCFALTAELLVDKAMELRFIGGIFGGNIKPTPFLCLVLKMLQIQPEKDIIIEFIKNEEFKYVRALGAYYLRLTGSAIDCYKYLEPLYNDNRKLRRQNRAGQYELVHMDEFIDELLREERVCDVILPRIQQRHVLEENNELPPKISALDLDDDIVEDEEDDDFDKDLEELKLLSEKEKKHDRKDRDKRRRHSRSSSRSRSRSDSRDKDDRRRKDDKDRRRDYDREERRRQEEEMERDWRRHEDERQERRRRDRDYDRGDRDYDRSDRYREKDRDRSDRYREKDRRRH